jgi:hypothetical protein
VKIKTIPGGHLVIIIRQFIGPVASWFPVTKVPSKDTSESTLKQEQNNFCNISNINQNLRLEESK